jgi:hypothetical protein
LILIPDVAGAFCVSVGTEGEEVCATGVFPSDPLAPTPSGKVVLPRITYSNRTNRDMTFWIEVAQTGRRVVEVELPPGVGTSRPSRILLDFLACEFTEIPDPIFVTFNAFGEGDIFNPLPYVVTVQKPFDSPDSDSDGLLDVWETTGFDADGDCPDPPTQACIDVDLPSMGADPMHKDIFVELDFQSGATIFKESIDEVKEAFALAPKNAGGTENPDGLPGINLWVDTGTVTNSSGELVGDNLGGGPLGGGNTLPATFLLDNNSTTTGSYTWRQLCLGGIDDGKICNTAPCDLASPEDGLGTCDPTAEFYYGKRSWFDFSRAPLFHYVILNGPTSGISFGSGEGGGNDYYLGATGDPLRLAYELMHELGHNLNLAHSGDPAEQNVSTCDNPPCSRNCEPNYLSIMNYRYPRIGTGPMILDFSPARLSSGKRVSALLADLEETKLDETIALDPRNSEHPLLYLGPPEVCQPMCSGGGRDGLQCAANDDCPDGACEGLAQANTSCSGDCAAQCDGGDRDGDACTDQSSCPGGTCVVGCAGDLQCGGGRCSGRSRNEIPDIPIDYNEDGALDRAIVHNIDRPFTKEFGALQNCDEERINPIPAPYEAEFAVAPGLTSWDDWSKISLPFFCRFPGDSADAVPVNAVTEPELTEEQVAAYLEEVNTTHLKVVKRGPEGPIEAAKEVELDYELEVSNLGPYVAGAVGVKDELPTGFQLISSDERCAEDTPGLVVCNLEHVRPFTTTSLSLRVGGAPSCSDGLPAALKNSVAVENLSRFAGPDPDPGDTSAVWETEVIDTSAPTIHCNAPLEVTPNAAPITFEATASDACDDGASIEITEFDCFAFTKKGRRIDKRESCVVEIAGHSITILDSGGVGDRITWHVTAGDASGNSSDANCGVVVVRQGSR